MTLIKHEITEGDAPKKLVGFYKAKIKDINAEVVTSKKGNEYTSLTVDIELKDGYDQKIFFRLPYDNWQQADGSVSLFRKFKDVTGMTKEELQDTKNYKGKKFGVIVGPQKSYNSNEYRTYEASNGTTRLSLSVIDIVEFSLSKDEIETYDNEQKEIFENATKEIRINAFKEPQPGFEDDDLNF